MEVQTIATKCVACKDANPVCNKGKQLFAQIAQAHDAIVENEQFHTLPVDQQNSIRTDYWNDVGRWNHHIGL